MESGFDPQIKTELEKRGYKVIEVPPGTAGVFGGYEAIMFDPVQHVYWGASEMRKDGEVIGY
jgi:gamma-glutamyltranspeptidase/glutathione hydrolase